MVIKKCNKLAVLSLVSLLSACSSGHWNTYVEPSQQQLVSTLDAQPQQAWSGQIHADSYPDITAPSNVRPCCAFGDKQKVTFVGVPIPFFRVNNVIDLEQIGPHTFAAGVYSFTSSSTSVLNTYGGENNGIFYTQRGGFIDLAHVRDTADDTIGLFFEVLAHLGQAHTIELVPELGRRYIEMKPFDTSELSDHDQWTIAAHLSARLAYFKAESHEIAQWHGYTSFAPFSERVSAYSLEDLYSNMLGATLTLKLIENQTMLSEQEYNKQLSIWLNATLTKLQIVDKPTSREALNVVDGVWWDSTVSLPNKYMLLKRHYQLGDHQTPYLLPNERLNATLSTNIDANAEPMPLRLLDSIANIRLDDIASLNMQISEAFYATFEHIPDDLWRQGISHHMFADIARYAEQFDTQEMQTLRNASQP
ncbi:DUF4056 domain-containing protein [Vibrio hippocampi]|uniref:DUF4056 domain-containing protein n=1 Tax=Vibrio hippocampi TaxID=654686 RepID=A0ABN8DJH9_9VIBR|nr:DUF4056 domain-containing protein [Vibrio hippocampi]CAH0529506.1 hypothetical protein VHP8226_03260 [Vibrio hippocampi]